MTFFHLLSVLLAALLAVAPAAGHMILAKPVPFGDPDNSPLSSSGANFPCKLTGSAETFYSSTPYSTNTMAVGETQTVSFTGSAVHGGGSCQFAITSDKQPSASTTWQVIQSIEGGCPTKDGNGPSTYDYSIPTSVAPGEYVFAWTWVSKLAGQPEYYMNCAPITVTAAKSRRGDDDFSADNETLAAVTARSDDATTLPNLFVANLESVNSCKTTPGTDPVFPDPGPNVVKPSEMTTNFQAPSGTDCFPIGGSSSGGSSSSSSDSSSSSVATASVAASSSSPKTSVATTASTTAGTFTTVTTSAAATTTPAVSIATTTTTPAVTTTTTAAPYSTSSTNGTTTSTGSSGLSGACTSEGMFNCVGGSEYQQCASGAWTALQAMPAGTACKPGQSTTLWARDGGAMRRMRWVRRSL